MDICPVCSSPISDDSFNSIPYPRKGRQRDQTQIPSTIRFCSKCGTGMAHPTISAKTADELYAQGEYWKRSTTKLPLKMFPVPFGLAQARWRLIEESLTQSRHKHEIRLLDIGAGHGYIGLIASLSHNVSLTEYHTTEPDPAMQQYLQGMWTKQGCNQKLVVTASMDQVTGQYDVVMLSHILEHLQNTSSLLKSVKSLLSPKGLLFVDVPNQDYLFKNDVFPHNIFFSLASLKFLLEKEQLEIVSIGIWGRSMYESPSYARAPIIIKLLGRLVGLSNRFLPNKFLVSFYSWYFSVNHVNVDGTWIRALCRQK